jgi:hypothetical protein
MATKRFNLAPDRRGPNHGIRDGGEEFFTLTSVLDFSAGTLVSFASNEKQLVLQRGTFDVEERVS